MIIEEVTLFTNIIQKQKQFYESVLGFEIVEDSKDRISFKTGESHLVFEYKKETNPAHIAFNIPVKTIHTALKWLKERIKVLSYEGEEITNFHAWNARAIYFYDVDHNILEFIARERLGIASEAAFTPDTIISISEMAIATDNIASIYSQINRIKPIPIFDGSFDRFCALGNDEGLFIVIDKNKKKWYPTMAAVLTSDFIIKGDYNFSFTNGEIKELS
ncbi:VOC family protein [Lacinutrix sp. Hel_I_90]|uniref:VOC family protein n=1 Tax=Lacinutrix sp. Hel_I_90 TaxID=1249999 RepID=UPI0005C80425|nr:VOC family protein [Lacinutrix sp. Hel_I_90]